MGTTYYRGQQLGRNDLNIFLVNAASTPVNAAEISYALYDFTTGQEVLVGVPLRTPANPSVGEYFASIIVPLDANLGDYRIRWTFREIVGGSVQQVVQEFSVIDKAGLSTSSASMITGSAINATTSELDLMGRLRILLRDNCVGGDEIVELDVDGERMLVRLDELWEVVRDASRTQEKISKAYFSSKLKVASVSPNGTLEWKRVLGVRKTEVPWESIFEVTTDFGKSVLTGGHRIFETPVTKKNTEKFQAGATALGIQVGIVKTIPINSVLKVDSRRYMFDLTAEDWHNFVLHKSKLVVSNSPDRNYHFRPPTHEETIQQFSRVFGYIWEDIELQEYLLRSLDMISASPPRTPFSSVDQMVSYRPEWRTLLLTGAMTHALQALRINWIADEFNYSIGGVSLDLDKSSKYEAAYQASADQFDKQLEKAKLTVNIVKGLQQPRFGMGIRSAWGPFVGKGVLSPRKFVGS